MRRRIGRHVQVHADCDAFRAFRYRCGNRRGRRTERARRLTEPRQADSDSVRRADRVFPARAAAGGVDLPRSTAAIRARGEVAGADRVLDDFVGGGAAAGDAVDGSDRSTETDRRIRDADRLLVQSRWIDIVPRSCIHLRRSGGGTPDDVRQPTGDDARADDHQQRRCGGAARITGHTLGHPRYLRFTTGRSRDHPRCRRADGHGADEHEPDWELPGDSRDG